MENAWDNVQESIGRAIVQNETVQTLIGEVTKAISGNTGELNANATANNLVSEAVIMLAKAASAGAEGIQFIGTAALATRQAVDAFALGLTDAYTWLQKIELYTQKKVNWATGSEESAKRIAEATQNLKWADEQYKELTDDMAAATASNASWVAGIDSLQAGLAGLVVKLEATKGKTKEVSATQAEATDVFNRATGGLNAQLIAASDVAKGVSSLKFGFHDLSTGITEWGLNTKVASLGAFSAMKDASADAMNGIMTGADGAAAAVFRITTEANAATAALSAVQSGAQLALPQGGSGEAYAPGHVTHDLMGLTGYELNKRYGTGVVGRTANPFTSGGGGSVVNVQAGAVVQNYPIQNDPQSMDQLASIVGDAVMARLTRSGARV
jgi:hypothetical protein